MHGVGAQLTNQEQAGRAPVAAPPSLGCPSFSLNARTTPSGPGNQTAQGVVRASKKKGGLPEKAAQPQAPASPATRPQPAPPPPPPPQLDIYVVADVFDMLLVAAAGAACTFTSSVDDKIPAAETNRWIRWQLAGARVPTILPMVGGNRSPPLPPYRRESEPKQTPSPGQLNVQLPVKHLPSPTNAPIPSPTLPAFSPSHLSSSMSRHQAPPAANQTPRIYLLLSHLSSSVSRSTSGTAPRAARAAILSSYSRSCRENEAALQAGRWVVGGVGWGGMGWRVPSNLTILQGGHGRAAG